MGFGVQGFPAAPTSSHVMVDSQKVGAASCYFLDMGLIRYDLGGSCHGRLDLSVMKTTCVQKNCLSSLPGHRNTQKQSKQNTKRGLNNQKRGLTEIIVQVQYGTLKASFGNYPGPYTKAVMLHPKVRNRKGASSPEARVTARMSPATWA